MMLTSFLFGLWLVLGTAEAFQSDDHDTGQHDNTTTSRDKRYMMKSPYLWPKALVPYIFEESALKDKEEILRVLAYIEDNSCVRFLPWNKDLYKQHGLSHSARVEFYKEEGCSSALGVSKKGVRANCCEGDICLHGMGYALGLNREQASKERLGWIDVIDQNIPEVERRFYAVKEDSMYKQTKLYDISTVMHIQQKYYHEDRPSFSKAFPELPIEGKEDFYYFKQLAEGYKCHEMPQCQGRKLVCNNDGYQTIQHGVCRCVCPEGLDPDTLCETPLREVPPNTWPKGQYSFLKPKTGCPFDKAFKEGQLLEFGPDGNYMAEDSKMAGSVSATTINLQFCTRTAEKGEEKEEGSKFNWPFGNFCVFRKGGECPTDFTSKSINYTVNLHATRGESPDLDPGHIALCCQYRGFTRRPAWFPADKPFTLVQHPFEEKCQEVRGMRYDLDLFSITSVDPISTHSDLWIWKSETFNSITIPLCQYTPVYLKCGGTYTMNKDRSSFDLGFTSEGPYAGACTQLFKGDMEKGTMIVDFDRIDLSQSNITTECEDKVEIRHALMGQRGLEYCGKIEHSIRSITDKLMISFITTGGKIPNVKGRIRWVSFDDMCYNVDNRGASYDGNVNYTRAFEPCLPWAEMDNCPHNPYTKVDEVERVDQLTGNACRNPDNSFRPWCYTDKVGCKRNYCDVCGLEKPYDHMPQCDKLKQIGFCKKDSAIAVKHCAATCFDQLTTKPLTKKYTDVYCTEPTIPKDSYMTSALKSRYALGETVWFQCKEGNGMSPTRCMTSGHWSKILSSACKACPKDYVKHGARCLGKTHTTKANYWSAVAKCQTEGGYLASPKSKEESLVINKVSGHLSVWIGINDVQVEGRWEYTEDESELTWTNWGEKEPNNIVNEDCAVMNPNGLKWLDVPCIYGYAFVCSFPTRESKECVDPLGENRCQNLLEDRPTFCEDLPVFANESCTKTCGICKDKNIMCPVIGDSNPDLKPVVTKNNGPAISVGQSITYSCQDFKYPVGGHGTRACLTSGKLTGEPLQCGDCPFGFILVDDQCLGLIPGKPLTYKEATAECKKLGGFITMPKTKAINDVINIIAGGVKIWIGVNDAVIEGTYDWQDGSVPYWKHWDKAEPKVPGTDYDCALLNEDRRWVNVECDGTMKLSTVCSLPRSDDDICYDMKDGGASYDGMVSHTRTFQSCLPWTEVTNCPHHAYSRGDAHANLVGNACRNPDKSYRPWCYTDAEGCKRNFCDVCGKESPKDKRLDCKQFESDGLCTKEPIRALQDCAATCFNQLPGSTPKKIYPAIKCGTPVPPSDGTVVGSPKPSYNVGETVEYKCKLAEWSVFARCMTSGRWSQTGFTCPACGVGYVQHGDKCYLLFRQHGTYEWAKDHCEKRGGQLAVPSSLAETRYLFTLLGQGSLMWIGLTDEVKEGNWVTSDGQHPKWTNWYNGSPGQNERENCAYTFPSTLKMYDGWCNNKMPFICTTPVLKSGLCEDYRADQCPNLLSQEPKMCATHPGFASLNCAKTCGLCSSGTGTCDIPKLGPNVMLVKSKHVTTGGYLEFGCSTDTYRTKGDTVRACLPNGEWTGQPLQCGDCPAGYKLVANTCIGLVEGRLQTFDEGREDCRKAGGYVAMPKSVAENDAISKLVHGRYVWIGTTDDVNEGHFVWEDGQILTWTNWADGSNNNKNDDKTNCVTLNTQREWVRIQCSSLFPIVCSIPLEGKRCKYAYNGKCYNLIGNSLLHHVMSYDDGMAVCKRDGGKMATPKNADEATFIRKVMDKDGQGSYAWLGINDRIDEGIWKYQDGGSLKWTNWIKNEPNNYGLEGEDCAVMGPNNLWADVSCNARYPVVCEVEQLIPQFVIQCPSPIPPSDAVVVSGENGVYFVGDTVEYKCNKGNSKVYSRCMSNSQWSESGFACMDCPGSSLNGYCYRTFNFTVTYDQATAVCHKIGYSLVAPRTQTEAHFIRTITTGVTVLWIGITDRVTEGQWLYEDGGHVTWTNWSPSEPNNLGTDGEDCAVMIGVLSKWIDVPCDYRYHRGPVCVKKMTIQ